jgi:hypothetical protein
MKHWILVVGLLVALTARPADAQTRVDVVVGFGVPRPFVSGFVVVGRPRPYFHQRAYAYRRPLFVERVYVVRHHHRHHDYRYYDRDYDEE